MMAHSDLLSNNLTALVKEIFGSATFLLLNRTTPHDAVLGIARMLNQIVRRLCKSTRQFLWKHHDMALHSMARRLFTCGDYDVQEHMCEVLVCLAQDADKKANTVNEWFVEISPSLVEPFLFLGPQHFKMECRKFLNTLNTSACWEEPQVLLFTCNFACMQKKILYDTEDSEGAELFLTVNHGSKVLSLMWVPSSTSKELQKHKLSELRVGNMDVKPELKCLLFASQVQLSVTLLGLPGWKDGVLKLRMPLHHASALTAALLKIFPEVTVDGEIQELLKNRETRSQISKKADDRSDITQFSGSQSCGQEFLLDKDVQWTGCPQAKRCPTRGLQHNEKSVSGGHPSPKSSSSPLPPIDKVAKSDEQSLTRQQSKQHKRKIFDRSEEDYGENKREKTPKKKSGRKQSVGSGSHDQESPVIMESQEGGCLKKKMAKNQAGEDSRDDNQKESKQMKTFKCQFCDYSINRQGRMKDHRHPNEEPYICPYCDKSFRCLRAFKEHKLTHVGDFSCDICGKKFSSSKYMNDHKRQFHTQDGRYSCSVCHKNFLRKFKLERHMYTHSGEKPYKCVLCTFATTENAALKSHISKTHSNNTAIIHECRICHVMCANQQTLTLHNKKYHSTFYKNK